MRLDIIELYKVTQELKKENQLLKEALIRSGIELGAGIIKAKVNNPGCK